MSIFDPDDFKGDPYGHVTNQTSHSFLVGGILLAYLPVMAYFCVMGEFPEKWLIVAWAAVSYAGFELLLQGWRGFDTVAERRVPWPCRPMTPRRSRRMSMLKIDFSQAITAEARAAEEQARSAAAARAEALAYLASTDWMIVRQAETGEAVPEDVLAARAEARKVASA